MERAGSPLVMGQIDRLVDALMTAGDYSAARRVWDQGLAMMNLPPLLGSPGSVVWDSSFESGLSGNTFSWRYKPIDQGVTVALDRSDRLTGIQSLRLGFDGKHNPDMDAAWTRAVVQPRTTYHFAGWRKTNNITTEQGLKFRVLPQYDAKAVALKTHEFHGTLPWTPCRARAKTKAANLAVTLAQLGDKTALVDADLRKPDVGRLLNLGTEKYAGMSSYLAGVSSLELVTVPHPATPNLAEIRRCPVTVS
jgi:hypothetical protein